ncbi:MAG: alpha-L-fucosidase [Marinilabiliaceae bacterium]|jgi:alpha-L-fucosidase|nr:alpha-L-fucosidase [Marinilabiliaceae bacterium]
MKKILLPLIILMLASPLMSQKYSPEWESLDSRPIPEWFQDARFGIFIHWGVYSVPAYRPLETGLYASYAEWYYARVYKNEASGGKEFHDSNYGPDFEYRQFGPMFRAELWDPGLWAEIFKASGAKYVVLSSKHHDGYCLWPTKSPYKKDWNSMTVGPHRDIVGELTNAVRAQGMKMGLYYSIIEWESTKTGRTESGYFLPADHIEKYKIPDEEYVDRHLIPQLKELVTNYKPSLLFADGGEWDYDDEYWKSRLFLSWLYNESPVKDEIVVNDRFAKGMPGKHGDYFSSEYQDADIDQQHPWEESRGIGGSYGYNRAENLDDYSSSKELIHELIDIVSRGGNLLLNVGPTSDGRIPVIQQQRLKDIGSWLGVNGEAIYGTRRSNIKADSESGIYFTKKENYLYLIFTKWPDDTIEINAEHLLAVKSVSFLGSDTKVEFERDINSLVIRVPQLNYNDLPCQDAWVLKIETEE